jgi:hypothetical protein
LTSELQFSHAVKPYLYARISAAAATIMTQAGGWGRKEEVVVKCLICSPGFVLLAERFRRKFRQGGQTYLDLTRTIKIVLGVRATMRGLRPQQQFARCFLALVQM